jgi:hypothetical protein
MYSIYQVGKAKVYTSPQTYLVFDERKLGKESARRQAWAEYHKYPQREGGNYYIEILDYQYNDDGKLFDCARVGSKNI